MEILSQKKNILEKDQKKKLDASVLQVSSVPKCSFSGTSADFYIGLSAIDENDSIRIMGAVSNDMVETGINKLLGQGWDKIKWPVVLDMRKKLLYHSHDAYKNGVSAILGWQELQSKS